jgi:hypothetical protein
MSRYQYKKVDAEVACARGGAENDFTSFHEDLVCWRAYKYLAFFHFPDSTPPFSPYYKVECVLIMFFPVQNPLASCLCAGRCVRETSFTERAAWKKTGNGPHVLRLLCNSKAHLGGYMASKS